LGNLAAESHDYHQRCRTLFYLPDIAVALIARHRKKIIFLGLPDTLDLLVVCVEAGLALDQAMRRVAEEMHKSCRLLSEEFGLANFQLQMGPVARGRASRIGSAHRRGRSENLAAVLIQAEKFGSSIAQALRAQSDAMRVRRRQIAEEKAAQNRRQADLSPGALYLSGHLRSPRGGPRLSRW